MSILVNLEAVPNRVRALVRLVAAYGPLEREEAKVRMIPVGEGGQFSGLVRETIKLGLLEDNEKLQLANGLEKKDVTDDARFLGLIDGKLFGEGLAPDDHNYPAAFALAWLLTRKPGFDLKWNGEYNTIIRAELVGDDTYDITNASRAAMLGYWARFCGYADASSAGNVKLIIPNPSDAIVRRLPAIFGKENELPIASFLAKLAKLCPVLEGGSIRTQVEQRLKKSRNESTLSPATSLAFFQLQVRGALHLSAPSDADVILLDQLQGTPQRVSHVRQGKSS